MDVKENELFFLPEKDMTSIYKMEDISDLPEAAYYHFTHYEEEIMYILKDGKMFGVCSIGDLQRFYEEDRYELDINQKYMFLQKIEYRTAEQFFACVKTVNEIPVLTQKSELAGIIKYEKEGMLRARQKQALKYARANAWHKREIERFVRKTKAKVLLYSYSNKDVIGNLSENELQILRNRREKAQRMEALEPLGMTNDEWKKFYQSEYEDGIVEDIINEVEWSKPVIKNGVTIFSDRSGKHYHFKNGCRVTPNNPADASRRIIMYGPCIMVGGYSKDECTIAYYLQNYLNENHYSDWKVLNKGMFNPDLCYGRMFEEELSEEDVVVIWCTKKPEPGKDRENVLFQGDLTEVFLKIPSLTDHLINHPLHCNHIVNQKIAEKMYRDICRVGALELHENGCKRERIQDYYINWDVYSYFMEYFCRYGLSKKTDQSITGAIVMNCNPFTRGHRYLVEQAMRRVECLYLFVVEEDKSYFSFQDRFRMVEQGVADLNSVQVVPSGQYILSKDTFAQYFVKEKVQIIEDMDYDIRIFGEVVAEYLGIRYRFVGEEPFDKVTKAYNETMKQILPEYGVSVIEIPRMTDDENVVSATLVRRALEEKKWDIVERFCPESTVTYLRNKGGVLQ